MLNTEKRIEALIVKNEEHIKSAQDSADTKLSRLQDQAEINIAELNAKADALVDAMPKLTR